LFYHLRQPAGHGAAMPQFERKMRMAAAACGL
jgi:hypothetical protein